jgi:hypothetical protein
MVAAECDLVVLLCVARLFRCDRTLRFAPSVCPRRHGSAIRTREGFRKKRNLLHFFRRREVS